MSTPISITDLTTLEKLSAFLDEESPELVEFLIRMWNNQQRAITYRELRNAIFNGQLSVSYLQQWQQDYSLFVTIAYAPIAERAIQISARELAAKYGGFIHDPQTNAMRMFIESHGSKLVREVSEAQHAAINTLVRQAAMTGDRSIDELARAIRPCVGLTQRQTKATYNFYNNLREMGIPPKRALERQAVYAARMHRNRAIVIAQTELAYAYNNGADMAIREAQVEGLIGRTVKVWLTAMDERVCPVCGELDGKKASLDEKFPGGFEIPPAHPRCRCMLTYDMELPELTGTQYSLKELNEMISSYNT